MQELERINQVKQLLVDTESLCTSLDEMYYKKNYHNIEQFSQIKEYDLKFRCCRDLLKLNLDRLKEVLDTNFNLFLALTLHLSVMQKEMDKINNLDVEEQKIDEDPLTVKGSDLDQDEKPKKKDKLDIEDQNNSETD
jgi:hypothetical protein